MQTKELHFTVRSLAVILLIVSVFAAVLVLFHRPLMCQAGFGVWASAWTRCTSQHLFDAYTLSHVLHGVIFYWLLRPLAGHVASPWLLVAAVVLEIGWELIENSPWVIEYYRQETASLDYTGDSIINSLGDVFATITGFLLAARISWKAAIAVFIILELLALYLSRDNLTLNVQMFLLPLDAIKEWQWAGRR